MGVCDLMDDTENEGKMELVVVEECPTEDAVTALMDYFLQPLLPVKSTKQHTPTLAQEEAVAKQANAVVILYNYFHRKRHPQLEFLDFVSFCELMTILKPQMLAYMKYMHLSKDKESKDTDVEKQISLTEKCIMDACGICKQLDTVQGLPTLETLPVCKVAVLLVDAEGESCYLQFSAITKGAWSLVEKEVDPVTLTGNDSEISEQPKGVYVRKRANRKIYGDYQFQKIAMSAITEATGINQANLKVVESHLVYSLNKENAAVRFFIFKSTKPFSEDITLIPIKYVVDSLQGPLVKKDCFSWSVTEAVEYFHMFPYAAIMSAWLSSDVRSKEVQETVSVSGVKSADISHTTREPSKTLASDESDGPISATSSAVHVGTKVSRDVFQKKTGICKSSMPKTAMISDNIDPNDFLESTKEKKGVSAVNTAKQAQIRVTTGGSGEKKGNSLEEQAVETKFHENSSDLMIGIENTCNNDLVACNHRRLHKDLNSVSQPSEPKDVLHAIASGGNILSQSALKVILRKREKLSKQRREIEDEIAQCDKTILSILSGREDDLAAKLESLMEACTDMNLTSPSPAGNVNKVLPSPVGYLDNVLPSHEDQPSVTPVPAKRKRASHVTPTSEKTCKELDELCHANNWGIPNYRFSQSRGEFQGSVTVNKEGIEISEKGDIYSNLFEARESAAKYMLGKLRSIDVNAM